METHFELIDKLFWLFGAVIEMAVFILACRMRSWGNIKMLAVFAGFRSFYEVALLGVMMAMPHLYARAFWTMEIIGYLIAGLLAVQIADRNRLNRHQPVMLLYSLMTMTALAIGTLSLIDSQLTSQMLRLARFADGICILNLFPAFRRRRIPQPYFRVALCIVFLTAGDMVCRTVQAFAGWAYWDIIARSYTVIQLLGWTALLWVVASPKSHPYRRSSRKAGALSPSDHPESQSSSAGLPLCLPCHPLSSIVAGLEPPSAVLS